MPLSAGLIYYPTEIVKHVAFYSPRYHEKPIQKIDRVLNIEDGESVMRIMHFSVYQDFAVSRLILRQ